MTFSSENKEKENGSNERWTVWFSFHIDDGNWSILFSSPSYKCTEKRLAHVRKWWYYLRQASGPGALTLVKRKLLWWHLLSWIYSNSPIVRLSTKVSPSPGSIRCCASELGFFYVGITWHARRPRKGNSIWTEAYLHITWCMFSLHMVPPQPIHVLQSFYTQRSEEQEEQLSFHCTALILIVQSSCITSYISSQLFNTWFLQA